MTDACQQDVTTDTELPCPRAQCTDFTIIPEHNTQKERPYGLPRKDGTEILPEQIWSEIWDFVLSQSWYFEEAHAEDAGDELVQSRLNYGAFMLGFDFHLTEEGPRLIEINTNAGGLATLFSLAPAADQQCLQGIFVSAVIAEYQAATQSRERPGCVAIVDEKVASQPMFAEMQFFAGLLEQNGVTCVVVSPEDLEIRDDNRLYHAGRRVDLVYNRLTDFRFVRPEHKHLRASAISNQVVVTPHPAAYARIADKRNLIRLDHPVVPKTYLLADKEMEYWSQTKKGYVFKPAEGNGSRGVYRGDKLSQAKLQELSPTTVVQQLCPPALSPHDNTKYDLRVFTCGTHLLGVATRHFTGQVMEMQSKQAGFRKCLPEGVESYTHLFALTKCPGGGKCSYSYGQQSARDGSGGCCFPICQCDPEQACSARCEEEACKCCRHD